MAGHARYTAVLDACVLYPIAIADALISLATAGFFAAKWTIQIEQEWIGAIERNRPELVGRLELRRNLMRQAIPDWEVPESAWSQVVHALELPDSNDRHVLAAAIIGHADCIVTLNLRDFPVNEVSRFGVEVIDPDSFIICQWDLDSVAAITAFKRMRERRKKPKSTPEDFADVFERVGLPTTAQRLRSVSELL